MFKQHKRLWFWLGVLLLLSPIGLILPELLKAGGAWGEWGIEEISEWMEKEGLPKFIPQGLKRLSEIWSSPFPDYTINGLERGIGAYISYILTGLIGVTAVVIVTYIIVKVLFSRRLHRNG